MRALLGVLLLVAVCASAAPPAQPGMEIVEGDPDGGVIMFPVVEPDGGVRHGIRIRSTGGAPLIIDSVTISGDAPNVFEVEGMFPASLMRFEEKSAQLPGMVVLVASVGAAHRDRAPPVSGDEPGEEDLAGPLSGGRKNYSPVVNGVARHSASESVELSSSSLFTTRE